MLRFAIVIAAGLASISSFPASASQWYLVMTEKSALFSAVAVYRVETSLIQTEPDKVAVWVRTDFLRPKGYKYPKQPRPRENVVSTDAFVWKKVRYVVSCRSQQIEVTHSSYMLAGEDIEWADRNPDVIRVTPDTISERVFKLVCFDQKARPIEDIQQDAAKIERTLLPDPREQDRIRKEQNVPRLQI